MRARTAQDVGNLVRARRNELRWSQQELCSRAEVSRPWLSHVEAGHPRAELSKLLDVFAELGLTLDLSPRNAG